MPIATHEKATYSDALEPEAIVAAPGGVRGHLLRIASVSTSSQIVSAAGALPLQPIEFALRREDGRWRIDSIDAKVQMSSIASAKILAVSVRTWIGLGALTAAGLMAAAPLASSAPPSAAAPSAASARPLLSTADRASFKRLERSLGGRSGVAVSALGAGGLPVRTAGTMQTAVAWSTSKVPVAMAVIAAGDEAAQRSNLRGAITRSDNAAAERLWDSLGGGQAAADAATAQLRRAGDGRTVVQSRRLRSNFTAFGQTSWRLSDQVRFTAGLECLSEGRAVLGLMRSVISAQRWGLGSASAGAPLKGGWGSGSKPGVAGGSIDRQLGIVTSGGRRYAVAIATAPADGSHETGTAHLTRIARWVVTHVDARSIASDPQCG